jgi:hypothetical protein
MQAGHLFGFQRGLRQFNSIDTTAHDLGFAPAFRTGWQQFPVL